VCKEFFELRGIYKKQTPRYKYDEFQKFIRFYKRYKKCKGYKINYSIHVVVETVKELGNTHTSHISIPPPAGTAGVILVMECWERDDSTV
jgi:hypothetical protein